MEERIITDDKIKCIEKHILSYIFKHNGFQENEQVNMLKYKIDDEIKTDFGSYISYGEIEDVLNDLIELKFIDKNSKNELSVYQKGLDYALMNNYITQGNIIDYCRVINNRQMDYILKQFENIKFVDDKLTNQGTSIDKKIDDINDKIKNFYNNIVSILALLIGAFSIIGFNISGIKFIVSGQEILPAWKYAISILVINISIVFSLVIIFYLVQKIINPEKSLFKFNSNKFKVNLFNNKVFQIFIIICNIILIISTMGCLYIILLHFNWTNPI